MIKDQESKLLDLIAKTDEKLDESKDRVYVRTARDQPAYISLLYPLICLLIFIDFREFNKSITQEWVYIFNTLTSVVLFIPALFFLYKMIIRNVSELFVEEMIFRVLGIPHRTVFISFNELIRISDSKSKAVLSKSRNIFKDVTTGEQTVLSVKKAYDDANGAQKKKWKEAFDDFHHHIKSLDIVTEHRIAADFNRTYGFYRNLAGGLILDCFLALIWLCAYSGGNKSNSSYSDNLGAIDDFIHFSIWWLVALVVFIVVLAYFARIKHIKRQIDIFVSQQDD